MVFSVLTSVSLETYQEELHKACNRVYLSRVPSLSPVASHAGMFTIDRKGVFPMCFIRQVSAILLNRFLCLSTTIYNMKYGLLVGLFM